MWFIIDICSPKTWTESEFSACTGNALLFAGLGITMPLLSPAAPSVFCISIIPWVHRKAGPGTRWKYFKKLQKKKSWCFSASRNKRRERIFFPVQMLMKTSLCSSSGFSWIHSGILCAHVCSGTQFYVHMCVQVYMSTSSALISPLCWISPHSLDVARPAKPLQPHPSPVQSYHKPPFSECSFSGTAYRFLACSWDNMWLNCWEKGIQGVVINGFCNFLSLLLLVVRSS